MIGTKNNQLVIAKHNADIPLQISRKGLYLMDLNDLIQISPVPRSLDSAAEAETHAQDDHDSGQEKDASLSADVTSNSIEAGVQTQESARKISTC